VLLDNGGGGIFDFLAVSRSRMARVPDATGREPADRRRPGRADERLEDTQDRLEDAQDIYTRHVATPTGLDFAAVAALYGLAHERVEDLFAFRAALEGSLHGGQGSSMIEVRGEREANVQLHRRVWEAVSRSLSPPGAEAAPTA
jgi:2-succinyl-5-enolpyruvyl-6-hydroxy-3-cyclohexene-1-carboxylate synthase